MLSVGELRIEGLVRLAKRVCGPQIDDWGWIIFIFAAGKALVLGLVKRVD